MSDTDLRPASGPGFRPERPSGSKWWEPLTNKWALLVGLMIVGFAVGVAANGMMGMWSGRIAVTESNRPKLLAALRPTLDAFYANPNDETQQAAVLAVTNYRRSFADALPDTLQTPSEKRECVPGIECRMVQDSQRSEQRATATALAAKLSHLSQESAAYRAGLVEAWTLERSFPVSEVTDIITRDRKRLDAEKDAENIRRRLFDAIDEGLRDVDRQRAVVGDWVKRFVAYHVAARDTLRPFRFNRDCVINQDFERPYLSACRDAVAEYQANLRALREEYLRQASGKGEQGAKAARQVVFQSKAAAIKKLITERLAPRSFVEEQISKIFEVF